MSFAKNGARVKYVNNLKRAPTDDFGPSGRGLYESCATVIEQLRELREKTLIYLCLAYY